jgi:hypothetical protein
MSLTSSSVELANASRVVRTRWEDTRLAWNDPVSRDFESRHLAPLLAQTEAALQAIDRLAPILARALRECS